MALTQEIQRRIKAKQAEIERIEDHIVELRMQVKAAESYIQGLNDILPKVAREEGVIPEEGKSVDVRPGSASDKVRTVLQQKGEPMHISAILTAIGKEPTKANRVSLGGTLARFVRDGVIFTRPAPNTFGLFAFAAKPKQAPPQENASPGLDLPEGFGK